MPRRKKKKTRRSTDMKLLNVAESIAYANIITSNIFNTDVYDFAVGKDNLKLGSGATFQGVYNAALSEPYSAQTGADRITLRELISNPTVGMGVAAANWTNNWDTLAVQTLGVSIGFKFGKKLLRRPISNINRNIFKPLGVGIKL